MPVPTGAVGAVFHGAVLLHGVGKAGEDESGPVTGLPSVEELAPEGTGKYPYGGGWYPLGLPEEEVALVTGTIEPETEIVELRVTVWVVVPVLVESEGVTGEPSVDEVETVPFLGMLLKLAETVVLLEVTLPIGLQLEPVPYAGGP